MALGGVALIVDRFVGWSGPAESVGAYVSEASAPAQFDSAHDVAIPELPFPRGIAPLDATAVVPDFFAPPGLRGVTGISRDGAYNELSGTAHPPSPDHLSAAQFKLEHRLNGLLVEERLRIANVDGRWIDFGAALDGCKLTGITSAQATFECYDGEAALVLQRRVDRPNR